MSVKREVLRNFYQKLDKVYTRIDKRQLRRTKNIRLIPDFKNRKGGKLSYAEWAHVIGMFQTLMYHILDKKTGNKILDVGCGTGLLGIAAEPLIYDGGIYTGMDVMAYDINFCKSHYDTGNYNFIHLDIASPTYAPTQINERTPWPVESDAYDLVTALSVWTHMREEDAIFYLKEVYRVMKPGAKAIITFFYMDDDYKNYANNRNGEVSKYHTVKNKRALFTKSAYGSKYWFTHQNVKNPEDAIGITEEARQILLKESSLKLVKHYPGNWKEIPGMYFQDIFILEK